MGQATSTRPLQNILNWVSIASLLAAGVLLIVYLFLAVDWLGRPFIGATYSQALVIEDVEPFSGEAWEALSQGVLPGDTIIAIAPAGSEGQGFDIGREDAHSTFADQLNNYEVGETIRITLRPTDADHDNMICDPTLGVCETDIELKQMPIADFAIHFGMGYATGVIILLLGGFVLSRRFDTRAAKFFAISASALSIVLAGRFDLMTTFVLGPAWIASGFFFAATLLTFAFTFPYDAQFIRRVPYVRYSPLVVALALSVIGIRIYSFEEVEGVLLAPLLAIVISSLVVVALMFFRRQYSQSPIIREQATFVGLGAGFAFAPLLVWGAYTSITNGLIIHELTPIAQISVLLYVLSVSYATLQYNLLETDRIIPEAIVYTILVGLLLGGYYLFVTGVSLFIVDSVSANNQILVGIVLGIVVLLFNPLRIRLRDLIDRGMFRQRRNYQERRENFNRKLSDAVNLEDILSVIRVELQDTVAPEHVFMFVFNNRTDAYQALPKPGETRPEVDLSFESDSGLVAYLRDEQSVLYLEPGQPLPFTLTNNRAELAILDTPLWLRLQGSNRLQGILAVGRRRNGDNYTYEDVRYVENLVEQAALVVERAQFVDDLEQRVQIQNALSQLSQTLTFTMSTSDTLYELLYTQISRILPVDHFFIVLGDVENNEEETKEKEIGYAFYATSDEERSEKMLNMKWKPGRDMVSQVFTRRTALRTANYTHDQLTSDMTFDKYLPGIHAWMGAPLISDSAGTIGVLGVGATDSSFRYSTEQFQLFRDISNIVSSALERVELFRSTEVRARQLGALNEISRELASELEDVDRLLETITKSAVNILQCEAGSLLLVDNDDLVFRVVEGGGAGEELKGSRIPRNEPSLANDALEQLEPIIVNNVQQSKRWHGEVRSDDDVESKVEDPTGFVSRAILTVPLIAQGTAVGALQVINKRDASGFKKEDGILAATFAGQAAIAIQNARLFESQDKQLLSRVEELENMTQIDQSMNRTLVFDQLVQTIMQWALRQTESDAGAFFVYDEETNGLSLVASYGYPDSSQFFIDYEQESIEPIPLDFNHSLLQRVVSSRQASLSINIDFDTNYVETLPGCQGQMATPLVSGDVLRGVIFVESRKNNYDLIVQESLNRLSDRASTAISNALLYSELQEQQSARAAFVSDIAHDLKTPITSMKGYTNLLLKGIVGPINDQQGRFLQTVHNNIDYLEFLVNDMRDAQYIQANRPLQLDMGSLDFKELLKECGSVVQQAYDDKSQTFEMDVPDDLPEIWADRDRLKRVLINFLTNANKYSEEEGHIVVSAEVADNKTWAPSSDVQKVLHIAVKDDGLGISQPDLDRLFERYFRSSNEKALAQKGTGLGLALSRNLIILHGGTIWVESELEVGSTFHFTIPLASEVITTRV